MYEYDDSILNDAYDKVLKGNCCIDYKVQELMNNIAKACINMAYIPEDYTASILTILRISNALYNNGANIILPLSDRLYDGLVNLCRIQNIPAPVGAPPIEFKNAPVYQEERPVLDSNDGKREVVQLVDKSDMVFYPVLTHNANRPIPEDYIVHPDSTMIKKKSRNVPHLYDMCGTLDKCNYVLNSDAMRAGVFYDHSFMIFERDFLGMHISNGLVDPNDIHLVLSLKYDGISVEADILGSKISTACTRGDTDTDEASDLTPIFGGMEFPRAKGIIDETERFGIKFEYIVTNYNLQRIQQDFGKRYVNPRNAVIGLTSGLDARKYRDYLTPVPLESSLNIPRPAELEFLNKYYSKDVTMRYAEIRGNYQQVLFMVKKFVSEAEDLRDFMGFQYDGIVVEYVDDRLRQRFGKRKGSIPRYAIAIKFNPMVKRSIFSYYTYSVGQDGTVVPMAHFKPVEFFGAIHDKTTAHSYKRFRELGLHSGDRVELTLRNDVILYITRVPQDEQFPNDAPLEQFPTNCPSCDQPLVLSESGDSVMCVNFFCPERCVARITNMLAKLNVKDFSTETIRKLQVRTLRDLFQRATDIRALSITLGSEVLARKFIERMEQMRNNPYPDYRMIGSLGFTSIASETWRTIFQQLSLQRIMEDPSELKTLNSIKGIGPKTVSTIVAEFAYFVDDIKFIMQNFPNIVYTVPGYGNKPQVRFSGIRDRGLEQRFIEKGFDADGDRPVTAKTCILIVPYVGYESGNTKKAFKYLSKNISIAIGKAVEVNFNNYNQFVSLGITPMIMTVDEANRYIDSLQSTVLTNDLDSKIIV